MEHVEDVAEEIPPEENEDEKTAPAEVTPPPAPAPAEESLNVAHLLRNMAEALPYKRAVVYPAGWDDTGRIAYTHLTFEQLDRESDRMAHGLAEAGVTRGVRTILMVKPSLEFFSLTYALFKTGAVPVIIDPGMGVKRMVDCLRESRAEAFIGIPKAHLLRRLHPGAFKTVSVAVTVGRRYFWGGPTLESIARRPWTPFEIAETAPDETAAILFTTGSTGPAKGAVYDHAMFDAQIRMLQAHFDIGEDEIDLPTFPLFALFDPALGMTAVIPDMDPTKPAEANPERIIEAILNQGVTNLFASPALLDRLGIFADGKEIRLPSLRRVVSAGAPVSPAIIERFSTVLGPETEVHTPYGATEALPVSSLGSREILAETRKLTEQGFGICVGRPVDGMEVRIIRISDDPISEWSDDLVVENPDIGEITVKGGVVSRHYFERPDADALAKIKDGDGIWHRMGDLGWRDSKDRIWFCGRKSHRVITDSGPLYTIPVEAVFNTHPAVHRSALVGIGDPPSQKPVICIELHPGDATTDQDALRRELLNMAARHPLAREIKTILFHKAFPVDVRHNAKIFREQLAEWAK